MAMKIFDDAIFNEEAVLYFDPDFINTLDSHIEYLKTAPGAQYLEIPKDSLENYKGDFFAVLTDMQIMPKYHRIIMLLNHFMSPADYLGQEMQVFIPNLAEIDGIASVYRTGRSKLQLSIPAQ